MESDLLCPSKWSLGWSQVDLSKIFKVFEQILSE